MKKYFAEVSFKANVSQQGTQIIGAKTIKADFVSSGLSRTFRTRVSLDKLPKSGDYICLLNEDQIAKILIEDEGSDDFDTEEKIRAAFDFKVRRHRGTINRKECHWISLTDDGGV